MVEKCVVCYCKCVCVCVCVCVVCILSPRGASDRLQMVQYLRVCMCMCLVRVYVFS